MSVNNVFYVAELSANHNNSLETAHQILDAVADAGASAIKLQTYKPHTMTLELDSEQFRVANSNANWGGRTLFDLYSEAMTPWEWHSELFDHARERGLVPFSSPFDASAVDFLEDLGCPIYKIASFEVVDLGLIHYAAQTGKPLIISTGMASIEEISNAVETARQGGCEDLTLLKTTSSYPASPKNSNLKTMGLLGEIFRCKVGVSDHTLGIGAAVAAVTLGASVVEKHVTLRRESGGVDSSFSMEPNEFAELIRAAEDARASVGEVFFGASEEDRPSLAFRRSLYISSSVAKGSILTRESVRAVRPGYGLPVRDLDRVIGLELKHDVAPGTPVSMDLFK